MKRKFLSIFLIGAIGFCFSFLNSAFAQETGLSISPLIFELTANPGDVLTNQLKIYNQTDSIVSIRMETEDFKPVGEVGQVIVTPEEEMTYSLKRWVKITPTEFTLKPKEEKFISFEISVPENAEPGGKYGSILASTTGMIGKEVTGAALAPKAGALVLLTISGEVIEDLRIVEFSAPSFLETGPVPFMIRFENKGTVHLRPRGFVTITRPKFLFFEEEKIIDIPFPQQNVLPGTIRKIETTWNQKWLLGKYVATLVGSYGSANLPFNPPVLSFWVFPWKIALGLGLILLAVFAFFFKTRKRWKLALKVLIKGE